MRTHCDAISGTKTAAQRSIRAKAIEGAGPPGKVLETAKFAPQGMAIITSHKAKKWLKKQRIAQYSSDPGGQFVIFPMSDANLNDALGYPLHCSQQIPTNLSKGATSGTLTATTLSGLGMPVALTYVAVNLVTDVVYGVLDPRHARGAVHALDRELDLAAFRLVRGEELLAAHLREDFPPLPDGEIPLVVGERVKDLVEPHGLVEHAPQPQNGRPDHLDVTRATPVPRVLERPERDGLEALKPPFLAQNFVEFEIDLRGRSSKAKVVPLPFYKRSK